MNNKRVSPLFKFSLLLVLSIGLMIVDSRSSMLKQVRVVGSIITLPFEMVAQLPSRISDIIDRFYPDSALFDQYEELRKKQAVLDARLQRFEAIEMENQRLAKLMIGERNRFVTRRSERIAGRPALDACRGELEWCRRSVKRGRGWGGG